MAKDTKYLKFNGSSWVFQKRISPEVAKLLGYKSLVYTKSLGVDSLKEARALRNAQLVYLDRLQKAENSNPSYHDVLEKYRSMDTESLDQLFEKVNHEMTDEYSHIGHPEWDALSDEEKEVSTLPSYVREKDDIEYRVIASLTGNDPNFVPPEKWRMKFTEAVEKLTSELETEGLHPKTIGKYKNSVKLFLTYLGVKDSAVYKVERRDVRNFIQFMKKNNYSASHTSTTLSNLGNVWNYVREMENINTENPFRDHRIQKKKKGERKKFYRNWDIENLQEIITSLADERDGYLDQLPVYLAWYTGSRGDEVYSVEPEDIKIDKETGITFIDFKGAFSLTEDPEGKTQNTSRRCPCHPELAELLKGFEGFKRPSFDAYSKVFMRIARRLGNDNPRHAFHSIRGNTSTALEMMQCPPHLASQIVGHSKNSTFTYDYYSEGAGLKVLYDYVKQIPKL